MEVLLEGLAQREKDRDMSACLSNEDPPQASAPACSLLAVRWGHSDTENVGSE